RPKECSPASTISWIPASKQPCRTNTRPRTGWRRLRGRLEDYVTANSSLHRRQITRSKRSNAECNNLDVKQVFIRKGLEPGLKYPEASSHPARLSVLSSPRRY